VLSGIAHVDLVCRDIERSVAFYRAVLEPLGLGPTVTFEGERGETIHYLRMPEEGSIGLRAASGDEAGQPFSLYAPGLHHVAFGAGSRRDVERAYAAALAAGAEVLHPPRPFPAYAEGYYATFFLDPDGFRVEVRTRRAPTTRPAGPVTLRLITQATVRAVCDLPLAPGQTRYVAPNATSIAEAAYVPTAWLRAIFAGETPVGLLALSLDEALPRYYLWRLMVSADHQGTGIGRDAVALAVAHVRGLPRASELLVSYAPGPEEPRGFYLGLGFEDTGRALNGERLLRLPLGPAA
jgi:diamine N-acetyltransferase